MNTFVYSFRPFLRGFASAFDLSGGVSLPRYAADEGKIAFRTPPIKTATSKDADIWSGFRRDYEALAGDWRRVGNDMRKAMNTVFHA